MILRSKSAIASGDTAIDPPISRPQLLLPFGTSI